MSHSMPPRAKRSSRAPNLPADLSKALAAARKKPEDEQAWDRLEEACRDHDRPEEAAALYSEVMESKAPLEVRVAVGLRAADFCEEWFEDVDPVLEMLSRILDIVPNHRLAFERLTVLLTVASRWSALLAAYNAALEACESNQERAQLLEEAARVARDFAGDAQLGSDYMKALLLLRPTDDQLAAVLEKRLDEQGRHQDLVDIWAARLPTLDPAAVPAVHLAMAKRLEDHLSDAAGALLALRGYLEAGGEPARAIPLLERLVESGAADVATQGAALAHLRAIHRATENWSAVVRVLERQLDLAVSDAETVLLHAEVARLLEGLGRPEEALAHATEVMRLAPSDEQALTLARDLAASVGATARFVDALVVAAVHAEDATAGPDGGERRVQLMLEAARLSVNSLADPARAIDLYARLADDPAAKREALLTSCQKLCSLLEATGERERELSYLVRRCELESAGGERRRVLGQAARLADELGHIEQSLELWNHCITDDPADAEALSSKIDLLARAEIYDGLVQALEARALGAPTEPQSRVDLVRTAEIYATRLSDVSTAIERWQVVEERFGRDDETVDQLVKLFGFSARHDEAAQILSQSIAHAESSGAASEARYVDQLGALGDVFRVDLDRLEEAVVLYERALTRQPRDVTSRAGLRALAYDKVQARRACESLAEALRAAQDWPELLALAETRLAAAPRPADAAEILLEAARMEEQFGAFGRAVGALGRALALDPARATEGELERLGQASGLWLQVADAYQGAIASCEDTGRLFELQSAHAVLEEQRTGRLVLATEAYGRALELREADVATAKSLIRVGLLAGCFRDAALGLVRVTLACGAINLELAHFFRSCAEATGTWDEVLGGFADAVASTPDLPSALAHDLKHLLAVWYRDCAEDPESAELVLRRAVQDFPDEASLRMLADLQRRAPGRPLIDTLLQLVEVTGGELTALREAGEVALARGSDPEFTRKILERAFATASERFRAEPPRSAVSAPRTEAEEVTAWSVDCLVALALFAGAPDRGIELLAEAALLPFSTEERVQRRFRAVQVAVDGGLVDLAVALGERLLVEVPGHAGAIALLSALHENSGRLDRLLELRGEELTLGPALERRVFLRLDQARVMGELGGSTEARLEVLRTNIAELPGHQDSIEAALVLLLAAGEHDLAARLLEEQAVVVARTDRACAAAMWIRAGELAAAHLGDLARLQADLRASVSAHPLREPLDRLAAIAREAQDRPQEVSWLEQRLALTPASSAGPAEQAERRAVVSRLGAALVLAEEFGPASELLAAELSVDPAADESRRLLSELYTSFEEWQRLAELLEGGVDFALDDAVRIEYLRRAAVIERRYLGRLDRAVTFLERALALSPADRELKLVLADCLLEFGGFERAREILRGLLEEFGRRRTKERASVHKLLARIARADGAFDEALAQAEEAAKIERMDPGILMLLAQMAHERGELDRAEQAYRTLALVVSRKTAGAEDESERVSESAILFELHQIALSRGNTQQASDLLTSALEVATRTMDEALSIDERLRTVGKADLLTEAIAAQLRVSDGATAASLLVTRAALFERNDQLDEALQTRLEALRLQPTSGRLLESTRKLAERLQATERLWRTMRQLAEENFLKPEVAGELWYRLGKLAEAAGESLEAVSLLERALETGYRPRRTFLALDAALAGRGEPQRVEAALARFVALPGADESADGLADALYRLAEIELTSGRVGPGTEHLLAAVELRLDDARALRLVEPVASSGAPELTALYLQVALSVGGAQSQLAAHLQAARLEDADPAMLARAVALARQEGEGAALRELLSRHIELAGSSFEFVGAEVFERASLAEGDGDLALTVELLGRLLPHSDGEERTEIALRMASLLAGPLGRSVEAIALYEGLLETQPGDRRVWQPLVELYRRTGREAAVEACIVLVEAHVKSQEDRDLLRMARVRLMVAAGRLDEAEAELRRTLDAEPDSEEAAAVLVELLRKAGRVAELRSLLLELFDRARTRGDRTQVVYCGVELAVLYPEERTEALAILTSGLPWAMTDLRYLSAMRSLQAEDTPADDRAEVLEHLIRLERADVATRLALELISVRKEQADDIGLGRAFELGFEVAPASVAISEGYLEYLRGHNDYGRLVVLLLGRAAAASDAAAAVEQFKEAAQLSDAMLGEPARAAAAMLSAFARRPEDVDLLRKSVDFLIRAGEVDAALAELARAIEEQDEMTLGDILDLRARVLEEQRSDDLASLVLASSDLRSALEQLLPEDQELDIQQRRTRILSNLRDVYVSRGDAVGERAVVLELAEQSVQQGEVETAIAALSSFLDEHPDDQHVAAQLGQLALQAEDFGAAVVAYQRLFDASAGSARRSAVLDLAAAADQLGDPMQARDALEQAFREDLGDGVIRERLRAMYSVSGAYRDLAELLMAEADSTEDDAARYSLLIEVGDLYLKADDGPSACESFEKARRLAPEPYVVTTKLAQAYLIRGEVEKAQISLDEALEIHGKRRTPELALLQHGLALVADARGDVDGLFTWLETALMTDRNNGAVATELATRAQDSGRYDAAIKALQVITLGKGESGMSKAEAYYRQAQIAADQGDPKKALMLARRAASTDGGFAPAAHLVEQLS